jgi:hypothetical protein
VPRIYGSAISGGPARNETPDLPLAAVKYVPVHRAQGVAHAVSGLGDSNMRRRLQDVKEATAQLEDLGYRWRDAQEWGRSVRQPGGRRRWTDADLAAQNVSVINAFVVKVLADAAEEKAS